MKPISNTAFYCCGVRMQDAENEKSVCLDIYAKDFMDERGLEILSAFKAEKNPNAGNAARHRIIDDIISAELVNNPVERCKNKLHRLPPDFFINKIAHDGEAEPAGN